MPKSTIINANEIFESAKILQLFEETGEKIIPSGSSRYTRCPNCGADPTEKKRTGVSISPAKNLAKCYQCEWSVTPQTFFKKHPKYQLEFVEAMQRLSDITRIPLRYEEDYKPKKTSKSKPINGYNSTFRDSQLIESGLNIEDITSEVILDEKTNKKTPLVRYESGSKDEAGNIVAGNDVVLHYVGLNRKLIHFYRKNKKGEPYGKSLPFNRVRWQFPDAHTDRYGKPMKYSSPAGSGVHLWYPEMLLKKFERSGKTDTLYVVEGEKKADLMAKYGMVTVGIGGITMLAQNDSLHPDFATIVNALKVQNVVFVTDSDWDIIKAGEKEPVNLRAQGFLAAVKNFERYFRSLRNLGHDLNLYFGYVNQVPDKPEIKGVDDLVVKLLDSDGGKLKQDFEAAQNEKNGQGQYVHCIEITQWSAAKFSQLFKMDSVETFLKHHQNELKSRGKFFYGRTEYQWNDDIQKFEVAQPIEYSEMFWEKNEGRNTRDSYDIQFHKFDTFCMNRGIGRITLQTKPRKIAAWVHADNKTKTIKTIDGIYIRDFVRDTLHEMQEYSVSNYIRSNSKLKDEKLEQLPYLDNEVKPLKHEKPLAYLFFKDLFWIITKDEIKERQPQDMEGYIWESQVIDAKPKLLPEPLVKVYKTPEGKWDAKFSQDGWNCHFLNFLFNTSKIIPKPYETYTLEEIDHTIQNFVNKLSGFGYLLHRYFDPAVAKGVFALDSIRDDQDENQGMGRSGKSLIGRALKELCNVTEIDGKSPDFDNDKFLFGRITEESDVVFVDDLGRRANMERFYNPIVGNLIVREMHKQDRPISRDQAPKFYFTTNFDIYGMLKSDSTADRVFIMLFGNYYNRDHRPSDEFGGLFFDDWEGSQWDLFYNLVACSLQVYLQYGLVSPTDQHVKNKLLFHSIHPNIKSWADNYFLEYDDKGQILTSKFYIPGNDPDLYRHERSKLFQDFLEHVRKENPRFTMSERIFKDNFRQWAEFNGFVFNPGRERKTGNKIMPDGGDWKSNGIEYFTIGLKGDQWISPEMDPNPF